MRTSGLVTICADDEPLSRSRLESLLGSRSDLDLVAVCCDAEELWAAYQAHEPELVVLDIRMPGLSGMELASHIAEQATRPVHFVFVTAFPESAVQAFALEAVDYVLKPYSRDRLYSAVDRVIERTRTRVTPVSGRPDRLSYRENGRVQYLPFRTIESIGAAGKRARVTLTSGRELPVRLSLKEIEQRVPTPPFYRVSRSAIVNLDEMLEMEELFNDTAEMNMRSGRVIRVSRRGRRFLRQHLER